MGGFVCASHRRKNKGFPTLKRTLNLGIEKGRLLKNSRPKGGLIQVVCYPTSPETVDITGFFEKFCIAIRTIRLSLDAIRVLSPAFSFARRSRPGQYLFCRHSPGSAWASAAAPGAMCRWHTIRHRPKRERKPVLIHSPPGSRTAIRVLSPAFSYASPLAAWAVSILSPFKISDCFCSRDFCNIPSLFTFLWDLGKVNQDKRNHSSVIKHKTGPGIPLRESRTCFYKERVLQPGKGSPAGEKITCRRFPPRSAKLRLLRGEDPLPARSQRRAESHKRGPDRG